MKRHLEQSKKAAKLLRITQVAVIAIAANTGTALADNGGYSPSRNGVIGGAAGFAVGAGASRYYINRQDAKAATSNRSGMRTDTRGKRVRFNDRGNRTYKIQKSGKSRPVVVKTRKQGPRKIGMTDKQARELSKSKKAASTAKTKRNSRRLISHKSYQRNQSKLAKRQAAKSAVTNRSSMRTDTRRYTRPSSMQTDNRRYTRSSSAPAKSRRIARSGNPRFGHTSRAKTGNPRFGSTPHAKYSKGRHAARTKSRAGKINGSLRSARGQKRHLKNAAKNGKRFRTAKRIGKIAAGGAAGMVAGAALGEQVPDVFDAAEYSVKLVRDPRNAPRMLANTARGGVRMAGRMALTVTDPGKMVRNLRGAARGVGRSIASTGAYKSLARTRTGRTIGKGTRWAGRTASKGYRKLARSRTGRAVGTVTRTIDRQVFKRTNKGLRKAGRTISRGSKSVSRYAKKTSRKAKRTVKRIGKAAKKLKFW